MSDQSSRFDPGETRETPRPPSSGPTTSSGTDRRVFSSDVDLDGPLEAGMVLFGRYRLERLLGQGGMGSVWLVRNLALDAERALKLIGRGLADDRDARLRFQREARLAAKLTHPNAVVVHAAELTERGGFIEMECVRGQALSGMLKPGQPRPLPWINAILDPLCAVLQAAHDIGIVHRDLKPSNLMLVDGTETLKVLDFGIAKLVASDPTDDDIHTQTGTYLGTVPYSSPEQLRGEKVDARSDIYSLGVILYEFLTGHRPFQGATTKLISDHLSTPPPPFSAKAPEMKIAPEIERVVMRCLSKNPGERPQSARQLYEEFVEANLQGQAAAPEFPTTSAWPQRAAPVPARGRGVSPLLGFTLGMIAALALALVLVVSMWPRHLPSGTNPAATPPPGARSETRAESSIPAPIPLEPPAVDGEELMISAKEPDPVDAVAAKEERAERIPETKKRRIVADLTKRRIARPPAPPPTTLPPEDLKIKVSRQFPAPRGGFANRTTGLAFDGTSLFVSKFDTDVFEVDPADGTLLGSFTPPERSPMALTWGDSTFWMTGMTGNNMITRFKVDGDQSTVTGSFPLPQRGELSTMRGLGAPGTGNSGMAWDGEHLWMAGGSKVYGLDPESGKIQADLTMTFLDPVAGLAWDGRHLWVAHNAEFGVGGLGGGAARRAATGRAGISMRGDLTLKIVSPTVRGATLREYTVEVGTISAMTWGDGALWVVGQSSSFDRVPKIYRLDVTGKEPAVELDDQINP